MRYTFIKLYDATDCAAACMGMVCLHYRKETTITKLRDLMGTDLKGIHIWICVMRDQCQLLLGYLAGFLLKLKNTVECILDLIQKRKNSLGIW